MECSAMYTYEYMHTHNTHAHLYKRHITNYRMTKWSIGDDPQVSEKNPILMSLKPQTAHELP